MKQLRQGLQLAEEYGRNYDRPDDDVNAGEVERIGI
jgi:hypothetical protein